MKNIWLKKFGIILISSLLFFMSWTFMLEGSINSELYKLDGYPAQSQEAIVNVVDQNRWQLIFNSNQVRAKIRNKLLEYYGNVAPLISIDGLGIINTEEASARVKNAQNYVDFELKVDQAISRGIDNSLFRGIILKIAFVVIFLVTFLYSPQNSPKNNKKTNKK